MSATHAGLITQVARVRVITVRITTSRVARVEPDAYQRDFRHDHDGADYNPGDWTNARFSTDMHFDPERDRRDVRPDV
jgi:hypothetical protein